MLKLLLGTDWVANRNAILNRVADDVKHQRSGRILMVPELISHDAERRLCAVAGDRASRYAQVLTFTRLASRVCDSVGHRAQECMDDGGRVVAMASAVQQAQSRLKAYASVGTRPEFFVGLVDAVDEFKRCCITPEDLKAASMQTQGSLAQKLEELSLIFECYNGVCQRGKRDPRDQMTWLLEELEDSDFATEHTFYIDGFPDFTQQHLAILEHIIASGTDITVSLNTDKLDTASMAFEKSADTGVRLWRIAKCHGIKTEIVTVPSEMKHLAPVCEKLFQGRVDKVENGLSLYRADSAYQECMEAAERVLSLVHDGCRYRDISIVLADLQGYRNVLEMVFARCGIPVYISGTEEILEKSVIATVLAAVDTAMSDFDQKDVLRYLRTSLSPLSLETGDEMENYVILWGITGKKWLENWKNNPLGLGEVMTEAAQQQLGKLNEARLTALTPLIKLRKGLRAASKVSQQISAIYDFFQDIQLAEHLENMAKALDASGDNRGAQILGQLWEILVGALEQMYDVLGETAWPADVFTNLFKLLLSQYQVGTIPPVLDAVTVGPVNAMRCQETKHLFVLGAAEGAMPGYGSTAGVLTDQERVTLRTMGVPLAGDAMDGLQKEFSEIYGVFCGARESVTLSCPAGQPSFVYQRLLQMAVEETSEIAPIGPALVNKSDAAALLKRYHDRKLAQKLDLAAAYDAVAQKCSHDLGTVSQENVAALYRNKLRLSASQVDKQADCRLSYFLWYGVGVKERKPATVDPAEFGTYVHAVLEKTAAEVMEKGGFTAVSLDETLEIAQKHSDAYIRERFAELDTERMSYLFRRNSAELRMITRELWQELSESSFEPRFFELKFGDDGLLPAIEIPGHAVDAQLRGFVDRVDVWHDGKQDYFRVVDYKTGAKDFDYCDIFNGLGLQMLLYLFALEAGGDKLIGENPIPAAVQYFPARAPLISANGQLGEEEANAERNKLWKRKGLLLEDERVLQAMEPSEKPVRLPYTKKKDGSIAGDLADREELGLLKQYVFRLLGKLVDEIASGCVTPNPYTRGDSHNACRYCPYGAVCHVADVENRRNYKKMPADRFWEEVRKEMSSHG